ncbi:MAG: nucleotidyltransferase domain-containing protein [Patescibacteria group bacterium]
MTIEEVAKKYDVSLIVLFGSQAKGNTHKHSDTDVAFLPNKNLSFLEESGLVGDIGQTLKTDVDAINIKKASPLILYNIFKYGKSLYEKDRGLFSEYFIKSLRLYEEATPLYKLRLALL